MPIAVLLALALIVFVGYGVLTGATAAILSSSAAPDSDSVLLPASLTVPNVPSNIVPTNPKTWPTGDRLWDCCRAIAIAEGYNVPGSNPAVLNNPGDISDGKGTFGSEFHSGSDITKFPDAQTGWRWLYAKLKNAATGNSAVYFPDMSWNEIGQKWAPPNAAIWASNVSSYLGVDADSSLIDYVNGV